MCNVRNVKNEFLWQLLEGWIYNIKKFREAMTKKEQCKANLVPIWGPNPTYDKLPIEKMRKEYHEYCPKSKSNNIVFCPKQIIKRKRDIRIKWINDYFKNLGKRSRKKKTKKRGKTRRSRKKKKNRKRKKKSKRRRRQ